MSLSGPSISDRCLELLLNGRDSSILILTRSPFSWSPIATMIDSLGTCGVLRIARRTGETSFVDQYDNNRLLGPARLDQAVMLEEFPRVVDPGPVDIQVVRIVWAVDEEGVVRQTVLDVCVVDVVDAAVDVAALVFALEETGDVAKCVLGSLVKKGLFNNAFSVFGEPESKVVRALHQFCARLERAREADTSSSESGKGSAGNVLLARDLVESLNLAEAERDALAAELESVLKRASSDRASARKRIAELDSALALKEKELRGMQSQLESIEKDVRVRLQGLTELATESERTARKQVVELRDRCETQTAQIKDLLAQVEKDNQSKHNIDREIDFEKVCLVQSQLLASNVDLALTEKRIDNEQDAKDILAEYLELVSAGPPEPAKILRVQVKMLRTLTGARRIGH